jgi:hypothetical protein
MTNNACSMHKVSAIFRLIFKAQRIQHFTYLTIEFETDVHKIKILGHILFR